MGETMSTAEIERMRKYVESRGFFFQHAPGAHVVKIKARQTSKLIMRGRLSAEEDSTALAERMISELLAWEREAGNPIADVLLYRSVALRGRKVYEHE